MAKTKKKAKKKARGRPRLNPGQGMEVTVRVRMTTSMRSALRAVATKADQSVSEYMRDLVARELDERT